MKNIVWNFSPDNGYGYCHYVTHVPNRTFSITHNIKSGSFNIVDYHPDSDSRDYDYLEERIENTDIESVKTIQNDRIVKYINDLKAELTKFLEV